MRDVILVQEEDGSVVKYKRVEAPTQQNQPKPKPKTKLKAKPASTGTPTPTPAQEYHLRDCRVVIDNLTVGEIAKKIAEVESTSNTRSELMAIGNCSNSKQMDSLINLFSQDWFTEVNTSVDQIVTSFARLKLGGTATLTELPNLLNVQFRMNVPSDDNYSVKHTTTTASKYLDFVKAIQLNSNSMGLWADAIEFQLSSGNGGGTFLLFCVMNGV